MYEYNRRIRAATLVATVAVWSGLALAGPNSELVATYSEPAWTGPLESEILKSQQALHQWLMANRARSGKAYVDFQIAIDATDRTDIGQSSTKSGVLSPEERRLRVGVVKPLDTEISFEGPGEAKLSGAYQSDHGATRIMKNGFVWTGVAHSKDATALRVHFTGVDLPDGAALYVYNAKGQAFGPYAGKGPLGNGDFWSHTVNGPTLYIQLHFEGDLNGAPVDRLGFKIAGVGHMGPRFLLPRYTNATREKAFCSFNASCVVNASCANVSGPIDQAAPGVAHILFRSGGFFFICSGGLLNDTDTSTQIPYFLTANHCISKKREASSMEAFWNFTTPCNGACYDPDGVVPSTLGASILATNRTSDYTLMQLASSPPLSTTFIGWSSQAVAFSDGVGLFRISHPQGAPQAYSEHVVDTGKPTCQTWPRGNWIYSHDTLGATEGGSSGSPVMNASGQVVGQLSGACGFDVDDVCNAQDNATVDGALAAYFSDVAQFLDPSDGGGDASVAHVDAITLSLRTRGPWTNGVATVVVVDASGNPLANAAVTGTFSNGATGTDSDVTDSDGRAVLESDRTRGGISAFQFCVDDVSGTSITYDPGADQVSCPTFP